MLLCLPLIYLDGGWRVLAASAPFLFTILSVLAASPDAPPPEPMRLDRVVSWCPAALILAMAILPGVARRLITAPDTSCAAPEKHIIRNPARDPSVLYERGDASSRGGVPVITPKRLRAELRYSGNTLNLRDPPVLLDWAYDYKSRQLVTLVAPTEMLATRSEFLWVETRPLGPPDSHQLVERFGTWSGCGPQK